MNIRLEGTPADVKAFADALRATFNVRRESRDYRNRPPSRHVRRYLTAELRRARIVMDREAGDHRDDT